MYLKIGIFKTIILCANKAMTRYDCNSVGFVFRCKKQHIKIALQVKFYSRSTPLKLIVIIQKKSIQAQIGNTGFDSRLRVTCNIKFDCLQTKIYFEI